MNQINLGCLSKDEGESKYLAYQILRPPSKDRFRRRIGKPHHPVEIDNQDAIGVSIDYVSKVGLAGSQFLPAPL
jgi:hypothetical protein